MYGAKVRLRYAGFVSFLSMLFSVLTGLAFTTIVTRKLTPTDFGLWQVISVTIAYFAVITNIVGYWTPRFIARGENVAKSSLVYNTAAGVAATLAYILVSYGISGSLELNLFYFILFAPQVFLCYISMALEGVNKGYAPQHVGYSFMIFEVVKVVVAYILVAVTKQSLAGAIISVMLAQLSRVVYLLAVSRQIIGEGKLLKEHLIRFTKLAWIPLYCNLAGYINTLDVYMVVYFAKTTLPVALFRVAFTLSSIISYSASFSSALYPRILAHKSSKDIEETLKLTLMFAIPMSLGLITLANPLLCIFGVKYLQARQVLVALVPALLAASFSRVFETVILGAEEVDLNKKAGFKEYLKSNLFILPTAQYLVYGAYLAVLAALLATGPADIALTWSTVFTLSKAALAAWEYTYSRKLVKYSIPVISLAKYCIAGATMSAVLLALGAHKIVEVKIATLMLKFTPYVGIGAATYFAVLSAIDNYTRDLIKKSIKLFLSPHHSP